MILIVVLLTLIITFILQEILFKNKNKYKNKCINIYQSVKIPIFITCIVIIIYTFCINEKKEEDVSLFMTQPNF